ncbi:MAG: lysophospholipid acyltransferase family protein, partial [Pseudomonadota bacterium]
MSGPQLFAGAVAALAGLWVLWRFHRAVWRARRADWGNAGLNWLDGLNRVFCRHFHRLPETRLPLPDEGPVVVVSNHVSGLDPMLLTASADRPLRFLIAREQYDRPWLTWLFRAMGCIPVDRGGRPDRALRMALVALRAGEAVAIFPHGKIHLPDDPPRPLKAGAARLALAVGCPIVPARIEGVRGMGR